MQVGPVHGRVGLAVARQGHGAQAQLPEIGASVGIAHMQCFGECGAGLKCIGQAPVGQHARGIGPELQTGSDLAKNRCLLQQHGRHARTGQGQGAGHAADATAGDDHLLVHAGIVPVATGRALTGSG
ncbi:hypothetical protein D9M68_689520 [compost metagenome]